MGFIRWSIASHDRQIGELVEQGQETAALLQRVIEAQNRDAEHINALVRIAEIHERRLSDLEGGAEPA